MNILAVGAHPDDLEILCAGTLALYRQQGHQVVMAHACNGDKGHFEIPPKKLARTRAGEAEKSSSLIDAQSIGLGISDLEMEMDREIKMEFVELIRGSKPDLIITHHPDDYMPDHRLTSRMIFDASFMATLPHLATEHPHHEKITPIYYMDTIAGLQFQPEEYVDIEKTLDRKIEMLGCHASQVQWLKNHDGIDIIQFVTTVAEFRGLQCGAKYAEAFTREKTWPRNPTGRYLP